MRAPRTAGRTFVAAMVAIVLTVFAALPAEGFRAREVAVEPVVGPELPVSYPVFRPQYGERPTVAFGGSVFLSVWQSSTRGLVFTRVDRAGTVLDIGGVALDTGADPVVAFDGTNFLVVWQGTGAVFGKRVSQAGVVLDDVPIRLSSGPDQPTGPAIDFDGTNYFVAWTVSNETGSNIYATRVSPGGVVLEPADLPIATAPSYRDSVAVAFNGTDHLVVWEQWDPSQATDLDITGTLVTTSGIPANPSGVPISTAERSQIDPVVASVGTSFTVAWHDQRSGDESLGEIYGSRVDATGTVLDPSGIAIATGSDGGAFPSIASDGTNALVAFIVPRVDQASLHVARVDASGAVLDPSPVPLPISGLESAVAFGGGNYFAVGWDPEGIRGARVSRRAAVLDPAGITVSMGMNDQSGSDLAFDGTNHLVVWSDDRLEGDGPGLYAGRVGPDGQVLDGTGFMLATGRNSSNLPRSASVAFDGTNFLVTWIEDGRPVIRAARISREGVVLDRFDVVSSSELSSSTVAFGGGGYLVTWYSSQDTGSGGYDHTLHGARVGTDGQVLDPDGFVISAEHNSAPPGSVDVAYGATSFLVVWDRPSGGGRSVVGARIMTQDPGPVPTPEVFPVSTAPGYESGARIAWNGSVHLVVWQLADDVSTPPADLYGARVDDSGVVLDPAGITISTAPHGQQAPSIAANGQFLVTWIDRRRGDDYDGDIYAARVDSDGTVAHPDGFAVATSVGSPYLTGGPVAVPAAGTGNFSVAYQRFIAADPFWSNRAFIRHVSPK